MNELSIVATIDSFEVKGPDSRIISTIMRSCFYAHTCGVIPFSALLGRPDVAKILDVVTVQVVNNEFEQYTIRVGCVLLKCFQSA